LIKRLASHNSNIVNGFHGFLRIFQFAVNHELVEMRGGIEKFEAINFCKSNNKQGNHKGLPLQLYGSADFSDNKPEAFTGLFKTNRLF
jgi:hypothetical protein